MCKKHFRVQVVFEGSNRPCFERIVDYDSSIEIPLSNLIKCFDFLFPVKKRILIELI